MCSKYLESLKLHLLAQVYQHLYSASVFNFHFRAQDTSPGRRSSRSRRGTRQLDFFQAMADFKNMFPTLDDEVIEAVLRANDGAVDATIDQLLTMTIDEDMSNVHVTENTEFKMVCSQ